MKNLPLFLTALSGFLAVAMGAAGAHAISGEHAQDMVRQAALYQLVHTLALLWLAEKSGRLALAAKIFFAGGIVLFSVALYLRYAAETIIPSGTIPLGGGCYMLGWLALAGHAALTNRTA